MATIKTVLKKTYHAALVKVTGSGIDSSTISLGVDLLAANEELVAGGTPTVNIAGFVCTGSVDSEITITRGGAVIATLLPSAMAAIDFSASGLIPDPIGNTSDIVVSFTGTKGEVWINVKKVAGYANTDYLTAVSS